MHFNSDSGNNVKITEDDTTQPIPDLSRRYTLVPPPSLEEVEPDMENVEEGILLHVISQTFLLFKASIQNIQKMKKVRRVMKIMDINKIPPNKSIVNYNQHILDRDHLHQTQISNKISNKAIIIILKTMMNMKRKKKMMKTKKYRRMTMTKNC